MLNLWDIFPMSNMSCKSQLRMTRMNPISSFQSCPWEHSWDKKEELWSLPGAGWKKTPTKLTPRLWETRSCLATLHDMLYSQVILFKRAMRDCVATTQKWNHMLWYIYIYCYNAITVMSIQSCRIIQFPGPIQHEAGKSWHIVRSTE